MNFNWQGWRLSLPDDWNPVKLHGDFAQGHALLADMDRPRLGIRWTTPGGKFDGKKWGERTLVDQIGALAAGEAISSGKDGWRYSMIYMEPSPPGRDLWLGQSCISGRTMELAVHVYEGEVSPTDAIVRELADSQPDAEMDWAVFDMSCRMPARWRLETYQLNAGDLSLTFGFGSERMTIRQIALASLALKRKPIDRWLPDGELKPITVQTEDGRMLEGLSCRVDSPRRLFRKSKARWTAALHDAERDRLLLLESISTEQIESVARSVGWANQTVAL